MTSLRSVSGEGAVAASAGRKAADRRFSLFGNLVLALVVVGYTLSALVSQLSGAESGSINYGFRVFIVMLSLLLGLWTIVRGQYRFDALIVAFLAIYTLRMVVDLFYSGLPRIEDDFQFFLAAVLAPTLALGGGYIWYDQKTLAKLIAGIGGFAGIFLVYVLNFRADQILSETMGGRAALHFLNPISISYHGLFIAAAALILLASTRGWWNKLIWCAVVALGGYLLIAGGSRGPIVAMVLAVGFTGFTSSRAAGTYIALFVILGALLFALGAPELIVERFLSAGNDASSLERFQSMQLTLGLAADHPIFGYGYIEPITNSYPHNLLVESAMALGVFGAALMLTMQVSLLLGAWRLAKSGEWLLPFLAMTTFADAWISGSIWTSGLFFSILWIVKGKLSHGEPRFANAPTGARLMHGA